MGQDIKGDRKVMKYIRTKNSLFKVVKENEDSFTVKCHYEKRPLLDEYDIGKWAVVAQADTIEELCDCYVIKDRDERLPFVSNTDFDYANNKDKNNFDVYGAIWVDVDLKSIAKMNDKGVLELL